MYYVRKIEKLSSTYKIKNMDIPDLEADLLITELLTKDNALSFWMCEDIANLEDTIKAILLSKSSIETSQFVILDSEQVEKCKLTIDPTKKGHTGYKGFSNLHVDLKDMTYEKMGLLLQSIKECLLSDEKNCEYKKAKVKELLKEVVENNLLDEENTNEHLFHDIQRYCMGKKKIS